MSRTLLIVPALLLLATSAMPVHAAQGTPPVAAPRLTSAPPSAGSQPAFASDRVIVRWKDPSKAAQRASAHHAVEVASLATPSHSVLRTQGRPVDVVIDELRHDPNVAWAERDYVVHVEDVVQGIVQAWKTGKTGERYILAGENITIKELFDLIVLARDASAASLGTGRSRFRPRSRSRSFG